VGEKRWHLLISANNGRQVAAWCGMSRQPYLGKTTMQYIYCIVVYQIRPEASKPTFQSCDFALADFENSERGYKSGADPRYQQ